MATNVADLIATLRMDTAQFTRGAETAERAAVKLTSKISMTTLGLSGMESQIAKLPTNLSNIGKQAETTGSKFGAMGKAMVAAFSIVAIKQVLDFGAAMFKVGMESEAFQRKYEAVFGANTAALDTWVTEHHAAFGKAEDEVQGYLAQIGNLLTGMGHTAEEAGTQATKILELAGAWSAWSGGQISVQDASDKLVKGMMGQTRGLIELGLKVTEQEVNARMAAEGLDTLTGAEASRAQQQVMWTLIQEKSTTAVGAYDEALGGAYGTSMELSTAMDEVKDAVGRMVVAAAPALEKLVPVVTAVAEAIEGIGFSHAAQNTERLAELWGQVLAGSAEESADAVSTLKEALGFVAQFMGLDAAQKTVYLTSHVNKMRTEYDMASDAVRSLAEVLRMRFGPLFGINVDDGMADAYSRFVRMRQLMAQAAATGITGNLSIDWDVDRADIALMERARLAMDANAKQAAIVKARMDAYAAAIRNVSSAMLANANPAFAAARAMEEYQRVIGDAASTQLEIAEATLALQAALDALRLDPSALTLAITAIATALGITNAEARKLLESLGLLQNVIPNQPGGSNPPIKYEAVGGPVYPGNPYIVGEQGPELFMPSQAGQIIPNNQLQSTGSSARYGTGAVIVNIDTALGDDTSIERIVSTAVRRARLRGEWHG
jgi:hypothetical protein